MTKREEGLLEEIGIRKLRWILGVLLKVKKRNEVIGKTPGGMHYYYYYSFQAFISSIYIAPLQVGLLRDYSEATTTTTTPSTPITTITTTSITTTTYYGHQYSHQTSCI